MSESAPTSSVTHTWRPKDGATLLDRYQILGIIGQGGMGTVYKGFHLSLKRYVAIKVLRVDQIASKDLVTRFLREMEAVGQMDHPNVVRAADAGKVNGVFYLVMEYLEGSDLSHLVTARGRLDAADACELARQTAVGLEYIHQSLVHRDIKPSNLILTTAGLVKILDLGLARLHEVGAGGECTPSGSALGTYDYLAPEQALASSRVDGRADIYSLGCTLFKLLTGRPPFPSPEYDSAARKLHAHGNLALTAAPDFGSIPEALRPVLLRMTAKDPAERYPTAREAADALAPFAAESQPLRVLQSAGGAVTPSLQPLPERLPEDMELLTASPHETPVHIRGVPEFCTATPPPRRRRLLVIGASALLACALAGAVWLLVLGLPRPWGNLWLASPPASSEPKPSSQGPNDETAAAEPRDLDTLTVRTHHPLLDQLPFPIWKEEGVPPAWRWDKGLQRVEVFSPGTLLLALGTTSRPNFTFEAGLDQSPWTGHVGLFWGYHEDADAKAARTPDREFARYQALCVGHRFDPARGNLYWVQRLQCGLRYNARGEIRDRITSLDRQDVPSPSGETILQIVVAHDQLQSAQIGSVPLTSLCSDLASDHFKLEPSRGVLGLVTYSSDVRFSNARFLPESGR